MNNIEEIVADEGAQLLAGSDAALAKLAVDVDAPSDYRMEVETTVSACRSLASPAANRVHAWLIRNRLKDGSCRQALGPEREPWDLLGLADRMAEWSPMGGWDKASAMERRKFSGRVHFLANQLAEALEDEMCPETPVILDLFDVDVLGAAVASEDREEPEWYFHLKQQSVASLLRRLGSKFGEFEFRRRVDARPATGNANQRTAARWIADWFTEHYGKVPNAIVADVVGLMLPEAFPPATEESVRDWRGAK